MMLRHSLDMPAEADVVEKAVDAVLSAGHRTRDLAAPGEAALNTAEMTALVVEKVKNP